MPDRLRSTSGVDLVTLAEQLLAIHYPVKYYPAPDHPVTECAECGRHWPCKTKRLIDKTNEACD